MKSLALTLIVFISTAARSEETLSLSSYLKEVEAQNLILKASEASVEAADARSAGISLPQPMVGVTQMRDSSGTASGFELNQTVPFPSKLSSDRSARKFELEAEKAAAKGLKNEVLAKARLLYISVWAAQERIQFLKEKRTSIQEHLKLSRASTRSDSFLTIHTLKVESDLDLLENEVLEAEQVLKEQQIALAEYVSKSPSDYHPSLENPPMTAIPSGPTLFAPFQLEAKKLNLEKLNARESEAKSSWFPDFNLRYRDIGGTPMTPGFREVMVGVSIPLFFWEPNAISKSAHAEKLKEEAEYSQEKIGTEAKTSSLLTRAESLKKQLDLISGKLLPRAEKRMRLVHNLAPRDTESLQDHREAMESFPDLKLRSLDLRIQYETTVAELSKLSSLRGER